MLFYFIKVKGEETGEGYMHVLTTRQKKHNNVIKIQPATTKINIAPH